MKGRDVTKQQKATRKPTAAEVHAARLRGDADPWADVAVDTTPAAVRLAARVQPVPKSEKPAAMSTAEWYGARHQESGGPPHAA